MIKVNNIVIFNTDTPRTNNNKKKSCLAISYSVFQTQEHRHHKLPGACKEAFITKDFNFLLQEPLLKVKNGNLVPNHWHYRPKPVVAALSFSFQFGQ